MSAKEKVFSIPELRLYILQYSIGEYKMERNTNCIDKCKQKTDRMVEQCMWEAFCCCICCFCYRPTWQILFNR